PRGRIAVPRRAATRRDRPEQRTVMARWPTVVGGPWHAEMPAPSVTARCATVAAGTGERESNGRDGRRPGGARGDTAWRARCRGCLPPARRAGRRADAAGQAHGRPALPRSAARQHRGLRGLPRAVARTGPAGRMSASPSPPAAEAARQGAGLLAGRRPAQAAAVRALQAALAAEHAAVYGYGIAGAHLGGA